MIVTFELLLAVIASAVAWVIGGFCGLQWGAAHSWSPGCWIGVAVLWGVCVCGFFWPDNDHWCD